MKKNYIMIAAVGVLLVAVVASSGCAFPNPPNPDYRGDAAITIAGCKTPSIPGSKLSVATPAGLGIGGQLTNATDNTGLEGRVIVLFASNNYKPGVPLADQKAKVVQVAQTTTDENGNYQFILKQRDAGYTYYAAVFGGDDTNDATSYKPIAEAQLPILVKDTLTSCPA